MIVPMPAPPQKPPQQPTPPPHPHPLDLYRLAVQHPLAEVAFIEHCWAHEHGGSSEPLLLREDFAGTCALAAAWCASDPDRQAMAVELDEPTAEWAAARFDDPDLHIVVADVMDIDEPAVDVTLALNFSVLIYHDRASLLAYLQLALRSLNPGGLLIMNLFGGDTAQPAQYAKPIEPDEAGFEPFTYHWDQGAADRGSGRIDCRIHFELSGGRRIDNAFIYDWRLWEAADLIEAAKQAGFEQAERWAPGSGESGCYRPVTCDPGPEDWVAYIVCRAPGLAE